MFSPAAWVEVDLDTIAHNTRQICSVLPTGTRLMAVVKADGYGHGAVEVARTALANGASWLGVSSLEEGVELRLAGLSCPILIFNPLSAYEIPLALQYGFRVTIVGLAEAVELARAVRELGAKAYVHLKVDTGLGRYGVPPSEVLETVERLMEVPGLALEGIYTHLADSFNLHRSRSRSQLKLFAEVLSSLESRGFQVTIRHALDSGGLLAFPEACYDMVRIGNLLYGFDVSGQARSRLDLRDPWTFRARVGQVKEVQRGTRMGYGGDFKAPYNMVMAVLPVGYSHGLGLEPVSKTYRWTNILRTVVKSLLSGLGLGGFWGLSTDNGPVCINGQSAPIVGRLFMGHCLVNITNIPGVKPGDIVTLSVRRALVNPRLPRIYLRGGQAFRIRTPYGTIDLSPGQHIEARGG